MNDTSGPSSPASSVSASLQSSLENRLQARMAGYGSPEYALTWKKWDMQSGPPICALRASVRRTSGKDFTGAGWPTPQTFDASNDGKPRALRYKGNAPSEAGNTRNPEMPGSWRGDLKDYAALAGWRSPDHNQRGGAYQDPTKVLKRMEAGHQVNLEDQAVLAGWATPYVYRAHESDKTAGAWYPDTMNQADITIQMLGRDTSGSAVGTGASGVYRLNPRFSLWLMGFPTSWASCGEQVTLSSPHSRRSSSKRSKKQERDD